MNAGRRFRPRDACAALLIAAASTTLGDCKAGLDAAAPQRTIIRLANPSSREGKSEDLSLSGLAQRYAQQLPSVDVQLASVRGAVATVKALQKGDADVGLASVDVAYLAFHGLLEDIPRPFENLRGIALLQVTTVQILVGPHSTIQSVSDLAGRRLTVTEGSGMNVLLKPILAAYGVDPRSIRLDVLDTAAAFDRLLTGAEDAFFYRTTYPSTRVTSALRLGARLIPLVGPSVERLRHDYPFIRLAVVPAGPALPKPVKTIAVDTVLLCRRELDEAMVYELTRGFFLELPKLSILGSLRFLDLDQAPAVPIPLHDGAARYYREVELRQ